MKHNSSFERTDRAIMMAFIKLMNEKPFEKITVQHILDETPVTRGTFYAHYHDKYEIAEKMLSIYMENRKSERSQVTADPSLISKDHILRMKPGFEKLLCKTLMKIHTENVDFRKAIAADYAREYLLNKEPTEKNIMESRLYAQLRTEMAFFIFEEDKEIPVSEFVDIMTNVSNYMHHKFQNEK